jgi:hypothetical protein
MSRRLVNAVNESRVYTDQVLEYLDKRPVLFRSIQAGMELENNPLQFNPAYEDMDLADITALIENRIAGVMSKCFPDSSTFYGRDFYDSAWKKLALEGKGLEYEENYGTKFAEPGWYERVNFYIFLTDKSSEYGHLESVLLKTIQEFLSNFHDKYKVSIKEDCRGSGGDEYECVICVSLSPN